MNVDELIAFMRRQLSKAEKTAHVQHERQLAEIAAIQELLTKLEDALFARVRATEADHLSALGAANIRAHTLEAAVRALAGPYLNAAPVRKQRHNANQQRML